MIRNKQEKTGIIIFAILLMATLWLPLTFNSPQNQNNFVLKQQVEVARDSTQVSSDHDEYEEVSSNGIHAFSFLFKVIYKFAYNDMLK